MENKQYRLGLIVGRFQVIHNGHIEIISKALELCERTAVFVGSSQESGTYKNPFDYETRREMLTDVFGSRIEVYPLPDIGVGNNSEWGKYVLQQVHDCTGEYPDLVVSGEEDRRISWFTEEMCPGLAEIYVPKTIDISATQMKQFLIDGDFESWEKYTDMHLWHRYRKMRKTVLECSENTETSSM